jgi:hypothetical protein
MARRKEPDMPMRSDRLDRLRIYLDGMQLKRLIQGGELITQPVNAGLFLLEFVPQQIEFRNQPFQLAG